MTLERLVAGLASRLPAIGPRHPVVALGYHAVVPAEPPDRWAVTRAAFERHLVLVAASGARVATAGELSGAAGPAAAVTFDDNLPSHVAEALPALRAAGMRATFFVNPGELGAPGALKRADVDALVAAGMAVGAHGYRHVVAARQTTEEFARAADACRAFLESLGMPLAWSYPGGHPGSFGRAHERILLDRGFRIRFTTLEAAVRTDRLDRPQGRYVIRRDSTDRYVEAALRGGLGLVRLAKRARAVAGGGERAA